MNDPSLQIKDLSKQLREKIKTDIIPYSVGLVGVKHNYNQEEAALLGSGTLIKFNNHYGILTANHVIDPKRSGLFRDSDEIGLGLGVDREKYTIKKNAFRIIKDGTTSQNNNRPDIALMIIPPNEVSIIKAKKSFWDISL